MIGRTLATAGALGPWVAQLARADELEPIALAPPQAGGLQLEQTLARRRSVRSYTRQAVPLAAVSQLLWAAQGVTAPGGLRTAPSAGALYPLELHLVAARVEGLRAGAYRYLPKLHKLQPAIPGMVLPELMRAALGQQPVDDAAAVFVIAAVEERSAQKYGARASRYVVFEAGAASQNLALQAAAQGLGTVVIGAFDDAAVARTLGLSAGELPLALMPVGRPG